GLALATGIAALVNASLLLRGLRRNGAFAASAGWPRFLVRVIIASALMAAAVCWLAGPLAAWLNAGIGERVLRLFLVIGAGLAVYAAALLLSGFRPGQLKTPADKDAASSV
ncbi:MAG TPA: polysaccharide biosynthesis C-terminal domain-containing protein, partial [Gammaproteobacteria bacterium]